MHMMKKVFAATALIGLMVVPALADEIVSLRAGYQLLSPEGTFAVGVNGVPGTSIDLESTLGFDDSENVTAEAAFQFGPVRLAVGYLPIQFSGQGTLNQDVVFNGQVFPAGTQASSDLDLDIYDVGLVVNLLNLDDAPVRLQLGPELAVKIVDADVSMTGSTTLLPGVQIQESESVVAPIPTLGGRARVGLGDWVALVGRAGYMEYEDNSFLDVDAQVEFSPIPMVGIYGGYRYFDVQIDESDILVDAQFSGPYVGAFVRF